MRPLLALSTGLVLAGCASVADTHGLGASSVGLYACTADRAAGARTLFVRVRPSPEGSALLLHVEGSAVESLDPVPGTGRRLFASPLHAWRVERFGGTLTDVENIDTYACRPLRS